MIPQNLDLPEAHANVDIFQQQLTLDVWADKYRYKGEKTPYETLLRCVEGVYAKDPSPEAKLLATKAVQRALFIPAGRIIAGAGTAKKVTLMNCYVTRKVIDSMEGIHAAVGDVMFTLKQGGGIGTDFSPLRPKGAALTTLGDGAMSSGAVSFMEVWDSACKTIMSAGYRRGAMMGTLRIDHPDVLEFIEAKREKGRLTNFNVSILVTDRFMECVDRDEIWYLTSPHMKAGVEGMATAPCGGGYIWHAIRARDLWQKILRNTYEYSEPGVIFIDRVNKENNLSYLEEISCTNPCGEQPLPPNGACNLGAINLARMVHSPFKSSACFDWTLLRAVASVAVRFLDNVIDVSGYPLLAQWKEEVDKRRIGVGITGLANAMAQLGMVYGSDESAKFARQIMQAIAETAYETSAELAQERGAFRLFNANEHLNRPFVKRLPDDIQEKIKKYGIRNGVLLTVAPTGTTSILAGNVSSGIEPVFAHKINRKVRQPDGNFREYTAYDYNLLLYSQYQDKYTPDQINMEALQAGVTAENIHVARHVAVQSAVQAWVDASVSKTINCPKEMTFEQFEQVYMLAYKSGCKGCTTYRPSEVRGSILEKAETTEPKAKTNDTAPLGVGGVRALLDRPMKLRGTTYKVRWPGLDAAYYITINDHENGPYEIFINSRSTKYQEWTVALSRMISSIFRQTDDFEFVFEELAQVASTHDSAWIDGKYYTSMVAYFADIIKGHVDGSLSLDPEENDTLLPDAAESASGGSESSLLLPGITSEPKGVGAELCPKCNMFAMQRREGCSVCTNCTYSTCG